MYRSIFSVLLLAVTATAVSLPAAGRDTAQKDIVDTAVSAGSFKTLVTAVQAAGLVETLKGEGPFTVFAPTDEAFAKVPKSALADLLKPENKAKLAAVLTYHVVPGRVVAGDLLKVGEAKTVQGAKAPFGLTVGGAKIIKTDIQCTNGVIHVIDAVIMPPQAKQEAKKVSQNPRTMIEHVVANGAQLYNSGHVCECANLYTNTMVELANHGQMPETSLQHINHTMEMANRTSDSDSRAWVLRRGLDALYRQM